MRYESITKEAANIMSQTIQYPFPSTKSIDIDETDETFYAIHVIVIPNRNRMFVKGLKYLPSVKCKIDCHFFDILHCKRDW